jgi:hypothetical protein
MEAEEQSLPPLRFDNQDDIGQFLADLDMIYQIALQFGGDFAHLYAEICNLYGILDKKDLDDPVKALLQIHCTGIIETTAKALEEAKVLQEECALCYTSCFVEPDKYFYIFNLLKSLKTYYLSLVDLIYEKRYLNDEFIKAINERLAFIISEPFEDLRKRFKVVESSNQTESTFETLH